MGNQNTSRSNNLEKKACAGVEVSCPGHGSTVSTTWYSMGSAGRERPPPSSQQPSTSWHHEEKTSSYKITMLRGMWMHQQRGIGFQVLPGVHIDTTMPHGMFALQLFAALAEYARVGASAQGEGHHLLQHFYVFFTELLRLSAPPVVDSPASP